MEKKRTKDHIDWYFEKLSDIASRVALANSVADLDHLQTEIVNLEEGQQKIWLPKGSELTNPLLLCYKSANG